MRLVSAETTVYHNLQRGHFQCECGSITDAMIADPEPPGAAP
jgi:hypothetical protein